MSAPHEIAVENTRRFRILWDHVIEAVKGAAAEGTMDSSDAVVYGVTHNLVRTLLEWSDMARAKGRDGKPLPFNTQEMMRNLADAAGTPVTVGNPPTQHACFFPAALASDVVAAVLEASREVQGGKK